MFPPSWLNPLHPSPKTRQKTPNSVRKWGRTSRNAPPETAHTSSKSDRISPILSENGDGTREDGKEESRRGTRDSGTRDGIRIPETAHASSKSDRKRPIPSENGEGRHATLPRKRPASPKSDRISPILCEGERGLAYSQNSRWKWEFTHRRRDENLRGTTYPAYIWQI